MTSEKDATKDSIVDFIEDEEYYQIKKDKQQVENATLGIYIFTAVSLLLYVMFLFINYNAISWMNFALTITVIAIYFCLAAYSSHKPFTAFIIILCLLGIFLLLEVFTASLSFKGLVIKTGLAVYISMRLRMAKKVQDYESKHPKL
jgi:predicted signal transduction protein with EAL and GGDEF domain